MPVSHKKPLKIIWSACIILDQSLSKTSELEILNALANLHHNVEFVALRSKKAEFGEPNIKLTPIPLRNVRAVTPVAFTLVEAFLLLERSIFSKTDYIITEPGMNIFGIIPSLLLRRFTKTKFVLDIRSPPVEVYGLPGFLEKLCFSVSMIIAKKTFDGMTIITPLMRNEFCSKFKIKKEFVGVWSSGVSSKVFDPTATRNKKSSLKNKLKLSGKFIVMYHGFLAGDRGLAETVHAIAALKKNHPDLVLFFLGAGSFENNLRSMVTDMGLQESVIVHGPVDYHLVPEFIAISDLGIVPLPNYPHWRNQCPLKVLEYLAMDKPVIVTDIPAHRMIIKNEKCGIYIKTAEPDEIAKGIALAYENRENLPEWGAEGREIIEKKYTWDTIAKEFERYLLKIGGQN